MSTPKLPPPPTYTGERPTIAESIALVDWLCERDRRLRAPRHPLRPDIDAAMAALGVNPFHDVATAAETSRPGGSADSSPVGLVGGPSGGGRVLTPKIAQWAEGAE